MLYLTLLVFLRLQSVLDFTLPTKKKACKFAEGLRESLGVKEFVEIKIDLIFV
jgi:hypothetical protein